MNNMLKQEGAINEGDNRTYLKLIAEQGVTTIKPYFFKKVKGEDGKYTVSEEKFTEVGGVIKSIRSTNNGKTGMKEVRGFNVAIQDGDEMYYVDSTISNASKDVANVCVNNIGANVTIQVYLNKNGYPSSSIKDALTGEKLKGLLEYPLDKKELYDAIVAQEVVYEAKIPEGISLEEIPF